MSTLYEITSAFPELMENENITPQDKDKIENELTELLVQKSTNIIGYSKDLELTIKAIKDEESRLKSNREILENRLDRFKEYVKTCMENIGIDKIQTPIGTLSIAKSPISVDIINENEIPDEYKTAEIITKVDKRKIIDNFKVTGEIPEGCKINSQNTNIRIK